MYQGLIKLIGPFLKNMQTNVVKEGDEFNYWVDENGEHLQYKPQGGFGSTGKILGIYCRLEFKDGSVFIERMSADDLSAIEKASKASSGPWKGPFREEMMKKSVFKRLYKRLPKNKFDENIHEAMQSAVQKDDEFDFKDINEPEVKKPTKGKPATGLKNILKDKGHDLPEPEPEIKDVTPKEPPVKENPPTPPEPI
jgi:recombination protein RecT